MTDWLTPEGFLAEAEAELCREGCVEFGKAQRK